MRGSLFSVGEGLPETGCSSGISLFLPGDSGDLESGGDAKGGLGEMAIGKEEA